MSSASEEKDLVILIVASLLFSIGSLVVGERMFFALGGVSFAVIAFLKGTTLKKAHVISLLMAIAISLFSCLQITVLQKIKAKRSLTPQGIKKNQEKVILTLFTAFDAARIFYNDHSRFPQDLYELVYAAPPYIDAKILKRKLTRYNYHIRTSVDQNQLVIVAIPNKGLKTGKVTLCIVEDGSIHYDRDGEDITSVSLCKLLPRLE